MQQVSRYHPLLVALHWLLALLIIATLILGFFGLAPMPNSDPFKIDVLRVHMAGGMLILFLMVVRFVVRMATSRPPPATTGYPGLDRIAPFSHYGFYVLVVLMAGTGLATALLSGLNTVVFGASGAPLPLDLKIYPARIAHGFIALLFVGLITLHVVAAFHHQFIRKNGLFGRMFFGQRVPDISAPAE
jgi:cytochrome b561